MIQGTCVSNLVLGQIAIQFLAPAGNKNNGLKQVTVQTCLANCRAEGEICAVFWVCFKFRYGTAANTHLDRATLVSFFAEAGRCT